MGADFCNALQLLSCVNTFAVLFEERNTNITSRASAVRHNILCAYCDVGISDSQVLYRSSWLCIKHTRLWALDIH